MPPRAFFVKSYFGGKVRIKTWRKLATLLRYQVGELRALTLLRDRYAARRHPLSGLFQAVIDEVNKGQPLDAAFVRWIPHEESMLIRGGIKSARLADALLDCAILIEAKAKIKASLTTAVTYPLLLICLFIVLLVVVSFFVVPELAAMTNPEAWDGAAAALYTICSFVASPAGLACFFALLLLALASFISLPTWTGRWRAKVENVPPWSFYRLITGSVWLFTVATLLRANTQLDFILSDMLESDVLHPWLRERVALIRDGYQSEADFGALLLKLDLNFPDKELAEDLAVYSSMPDFHKNLYAISKEWLDDGVEKIGLQAQILNVGLIVGVLGVLCGLALAIGSMQQQLTGSMGGF